MVDNTTQEPKMLSYIDLHPFAMLQIFHPFLFRGMMYLYIVYNAPNIWLSKRAKLKRKSKEQHFYMVDVLVKIKTKRVYNLY